MYFFSLKKIFIPISFPILTLENWFLYIMSYSFECSQLRDPSMLRQQFPIKGQQRIIYITVGTIGLVVSIFNVAVLVGVKALKEPPNQILLVLTTYCIVRIVIIDATLFYDDFNPRYASQNYNDFCVITGFVDVSIRTAKMIYTLILTVLYARKVRNPLQAWSTPQKEVHFLCLFITLLVAAVTFFTGKLGQTIYGYCGIQFSLANTYIMAASDLAYLLILVITSSRFLRNVNWISANNNIICQFYNYYLCFVVVICIDEVIAAVAGFILASSCAQDNLTMLKNSKIVVTVAQCSLSFFVLTVILFNPQFRRVLSIRLVSGLYQRYQRYIKKRKEEQLETELRPSFYDELMTTNRRTILVQLTTLATLDQGYLSDLKDKSRACLLSSLLGCLSLSFFQTRRALTSRENFRTSAVGDDKDEPFTWNYYETCTFTLTNAIVDHYVQIFTKKLPPVALRFTSYSPKVLQALSQQTSSKMDIWQTLAPYNNEQAIAKDCGGADGGNSGQFFFFTQNKTLILKTISLRERQVFLQRLEYFHRHFTDLPNSLIVRPYSISSVVNPDSGDQVNFCLMGNILNQINRQNVSRCYDLKGSFHSREVLKGCKSLEIIQRITQTLKDIDFDRFQGKIWVSNEDSERLKAIIRADSQFLCKLGLIDYSLLVIKLYTANLKSKALKRVRHWRSTREGEEDIVYVLGIIDYLETWNLRKKGEKWYKSLFVDKKKISSQNPIYYSNRFIAYATNLLSY